MLLIFVVFYESSKVLFMPEGSVGSPRGFLPRVRTGTKNSSQRSYKILISFALDLMRVLCVIMQLK